MHDYFSSLETSRNSFFDIKKKIIKFIFKERKKPNVRGSKTMYIVFAAAVAAANFLNTGKANGLFWNLPWLYFISHKSRNMVNKVLLSLTELWFQ